MGNWRYVLGKLCGSCVRGMPGPSDIAEDSEKLNTVEIQVPHPVATVAAGTGWETSFDQLDERQHISFNDLQLHKLLARGRHREVYRGYWFNTEVAVICMKGGGKIREARLLQRQCKHPNLQMFYGWSQDDNGNEYIVMELAAHGSLDVLLQQQGHTLRTADKMVLCEQVCAAMRALAVEGVKHGNLAASSVLVHSTQPWIVKVAGFELAEPVDLDRSDSGQTAVLCSISSPIVGGVECGSRACEAEKGDVKAFGVTMWQIMSNGAQVQAVGGQELPRPASCPAALYQLMQHCWAPAPADRPTFSQLSHQLQRWRTEYSKQVLSKHGLSRRNAPPSCTSVGTSVILSLSYPLQGSSLLPFPSGTLDQPPSLAEPDPDGSPHPIALLDIGQSLPCGRGGPEPGNQLRQPTTEAQPTKLRLQHGIQQLQHHMRHLLLDHQQLAAQPVVQDDYDSGKGSVCLEELPQAGHPWLPRHQVYEPPPSLAQSTASLLEYSGQSAGDAVIPEYEGVEPPGCSHHGPAQSAPRSPSPSAGGSCAGCLDDGEPPLELPLPPAFFAPAAAAATQAPLQWWSCAGKAAAVSTCPVWPANGLDTGLPRMCDSSQSSNHADAGAASLPCVHRLIVSLSSVPAMPLSSVHLPWTEKTPRSQCSSKATDAQDGSGVQLPQPLSCDQASQLQPCGGRMGRAPGPRSTLPAAVTCPPSPLGSKSAAQAASHFPSRSNGLSTTCSKSGLLHTALHHQQREIRSQLSTPGHWETTSPRAALSKQASLALALSTQMSFEVERCISPTFSSHTNTTAAAVPCSMWPTSPKPHMPSDKQARAPNITAMQHLVRSHSHQQVPTRAVDQLQRHCSSQAHEQQACELHRGSAQLEQQQQQLTPATAPVVRCSVSSGYLDLTDLQALLQSPHGCEGCDMGSSPSDTSEPGSAIWY